MQFKPKYDDTADNGESGSGDSSDTDTTGSSSSNGVWAHYDVDGGESSDSVWAYNDMSEDRETPSDPETEENCMQVLQENLGKRPRDKFQKLQDMQPPPKTVLLQLNIIFLLCNNTLYCRTSMSGTSNERLPLLTGKKITLTK